MGDTDPLPRKRRVEQLTPKFRWPIRERYALQAVSLPSSVDFWNVLQSRRSIRRMNCAPFSHVASVVRSVMKIIDEGVGDLEGRYRKAGISAGALHIVDAIVVSSKAREAILYSDVLDDFFSLQICNQALLDEFRIKASSVLPEANGDWIVLAADALLIEQHYMNSESLLWRDAGAVLQLLSMTSFAQGLAFCPLGISGDEAINAILDSKAGPIAVGVAAIGSAS